MVFVIVPLVCSTIVSAGIGIACAFIVKLVTETAQIGWTVFGILAALALLCFVLQCFSGSGGRSSTLAVM